MRARGVSPVVQCSVGHIRFAVCAERSCDNSLRFLRKFHPDKMMEHIDHDYLSTQVIKIPYKSKTSFSIPALCLLWKMSYREVAHERAQFMMTQLQISAIGIGAELPRLSVR